MDLSDANLSEVNLREVDLYEAKLCNAKLVRANLTKAMLSWANLQLADLTLAELTIAFLCRANLTGATLSGTKLVGAYLMDANLSKASLTDAKVTAAHLWGAMLQEANLTYADLRHSNLVQCDLTGAILTGAILYGTSRDDWKIKGVKCEYAYWDVEGKHRSPRDRDLEPGEFERLYASLPTIEYTFEHGMSPIDPLIMDRVVQAIRKRKPEFDITVDSINARGLAPSIRFTVQQEEHKESALEQVRKGYEIKLKQLESERDRYWELIKSAFDKPREVKLITAGPGAIVATDGSTINIQQHIHNALQLQKAIAEEPEGSDSFAKVAKKTALDIVGEALKDIAKGQVKEAAKQIVELGKDLGPLFVKMAPVAYKFFKGMVM